jgi:DNA-binding LacI/PurR family transcriptional regulator
MNQPTRIKNIGDLAKLAGVSTATVSRALSNSSLISLDTRNRIQSLAKQYDFQPSAVARNLRMQKTGAIGVVIHVGHERTQHVSDPFFMALLGHLADGLTERGFDLVLSRVIPENAEWLERMIDSGRCDGLIIIGQSDQSAVLDKVAATYHPLVVWGGYKPGQVHCSIGSDNFLGGKLAGQHLLDRGCRNLAFFGDPRAMEIGQRLEGFRAALEPMGLANQLTVVPTHLTADGQDLEINAWLENGAKPDGIFAASDVMAMNALRALSEQGLSVPDQVKVVGYDDLPLAQQLVPRLTTIKQDIAAGAGYLIDCLIKRIGDEETASIVMKPELIIRMST